MTVDRENDKRTARATGTDNDGRDYSDEAAKREVNVWAESEDMPSDYYDQSDAPEARQQPKSSADRVIADGLAATRDTDNEDAERALTALANVIKNIPPFTPDELTAAVAMVRREAKKVHELLGEHTELLTKHNPEQLPLDLDATGAHIIASRHSHGLRVADGEMRAWDGIRWTRGDKAKRFAQGRAREVGELFARLARDASTISKGCEDAGHMHLVVSQILQAHGHGHESNTLHALGKSLLKVAGEVRSESGGITETAQRLTSAAGTRAAIELAITLPALHAESRDFDAHPALLNCPNGIVDLRTGALLPHDPACMLTLMTRVPYDPSARAERFERFLCEVHPDDAARAYIARRWGYVLSGEMRDGTCQRF